MSEYLIIPVSVRALMPRERSTLRKLTLPGEGWMRDALDVNAIGPPRDTVILAAHWGFSPKDEIGGWAYLVPDLGDSGAVVATVFVAASARGQGLGEQLIRRLIQYWARERCWLRGRRVYFHTEHSEFAKALFVKLTTGPHPVRRLREYEELCR